MRQAVVRQSKNPSVDHGDEPQAARVRSAFNVRHLFYACLLLLGITWIPLFTVHFHRTWVGDDATGTVVAIFPPTLSTKTVFQNVIDADGAIVRPVSWARQVWVVRSVNAGFAGRLRKSGAWGVFSVDLLSADALFSCVRIGSFSAPASPSR
jgi:hypothetical protein